MAYHSNQNLFELYATDVCNRETRAAAAATESNFI